MPCWYRWSVNFSRRHFCLQTVFIYKCHVIWWSVRLLRVSCIVRSYFVSRVRLIKLTNETNDTPNERTNYTNETQTSGIRKTNERYTQTKPTKAQTIRNICQLKRSRICSTITFRSISLISVLTVLFLDFIDCIH